MNRLAIIFAINLLVSSCSLTTDSDPKFIIEGYLFAGEPVRNLKIKQQSSISEADSIEHLIEDAGVVLIKDNQEYLLFYENGTYRYDGNDLAVESGDIFRLEVTVGGRTAYAETTVPEVTSGLTLSKNKMIVPTLTLNFQLQQQLNQLFFNERITVRWDNPEEKLHFIVIEPVVSTLDPMFPEGFPQTASDFLAGFKFTPEANKLDTFSIISIAFETYGEHRVKVYRVNQEYADLFNNPKQDSRDLTDPPSNVVNGFGIFSAFAADSAFFTIERN